MAEGIGCGIHPLGLIGGVVLGALGTTLFIVGHERVSQIEGGYVDHVDDLGGVTSAGVTEAVARDDGYYGDMRDLGEDYAADIGYRNYWQPLHLDHIGSAADTAYAEVAYRLYDFAFNAGPSRSARALQRCLNVLNGSGRWYRDVTVDGVVGISTLRAFDGYVRRRGALGSERLLVCVEGMQVWHYVRISEARDRNESFTYGWFGRLR